jgi:hypothetical protein
VGLHRHAAEAEAEAGGAVSRPSVHTLITEVSVSAVPFDDPEADLFTLTVAWRGGETYAVFKRDHWNLSITGEWGFEVLPFERTDEWIATHRFSYDEALALAVKHAPQMTCNGQTAEQYLAWRAEQ